MTNYTRIHMCLGLKGLTNRKKDQNQRCLVRARFSAFRSGYMYIICKNIRTILISDKKVSKNKIVQNLKSVKCPKYLEYSKIMLVSRNKGDVIRKGFTMGRVVEAVTKELN